MNAVAEVARPKNDIVAQVEVSPSLVLIDKQKFNQFYEAMKEECEAHTPDLTTEKGRKAIASLAYKVARTKTAIDDAGKQLNEEARARINAIDESRREIRQQLDALKDEVRAPLTEWEQAEAAREQECTAKLEALRQAVALPFGATAADAKQRLAEIEGETLDADRLQGFHPQAVQLRDQAVTTLTFMVDQLTREETERAELEKLRAEALERERAQAEKAAAEAEERRRAEAEKAEQERIAKLQREAEERAKAEAEQKAREEREATERAHAEALATERCRAEEAERSAQAERDRIAREEADRKAAADAEAAEQARRDTDRAHRSKIMGAAKEAIMEAGEVDEAAAKRIVLAVAAGSIPNISIRF